MKSRTLSTLVLAGCVLQAVPGGPARAELCTIDAVPAATLLLPYFEVDLSRRGNVNTVFSIENLDAAPALAHVVLWTDWAIPTLNFDVYLTGYDIQQIDLGELFREGRLPETLGDSNVSGCSDVELTEDDVDRLQNAHTGRDTGAGCQAHDHGDDLARGYVTIDSTVECSLLFPGEGGYFDNGSGVASGINQLGGHYHLTERRGRGLASGALVAVEAEAPNGSSAGYTFYGRYVEGNGTDLREPLGTTWATRYLDRLPFGRNRRGVDNDVVIWRDTKFSGLEQFYECGEATPPWYPLNETQVVAFDEQEQAVELCFLVGEEGEDPVDPVCAPLATQRLRVGGGDLDVPFDEGWIYWNLNSTLGSGEGFFDFNGLAQSYMTSLLSVSGLRGELPAALLTTACATSE